MTADLANSISQLPRAEVNGTWHRHVPGRVIDEALTGQVAPSRWGSGQGGFPVLFLGRPDKSVVIEAYRHFVDPVVDRPDIVSQLAPRRMVTCTVAVGELLDLRTAAARVATGLDMRILQCGTDDRDAYSRCREIAAIAHQLGFHGLVAPAATGVGVGETLALFTRHLTNDELPMRSAPDVLWDPWPPDPRLPATHHLRVVRPSPDDD